jgi:hypothetical protein
LLITKSKTWSQWYRLEPRHKQTTNIKPKVTWHINIRPHLDLKIDYDCLRGQEVDVQQEIVGTVIGSVTPWNSRQSNRVVISDGDAGTMRLCRCRRLLTARSPKLRTLQWRWAVWPTAVLVSRLVEFSKYGCENGCSQYGVWWSMIALPATHREIRWH